MLHPNSITTRVDYNNTMKPSSLAPEKIITDRLILRRIYPTDVKQTHNLFNSLIDPEDVFQYCGWSKHNSINETKSYVQERITKWETSDKYEYLIYHIEEDELIGTCYIEPSDDFAYCVFGFWIRKPYWGKNISGERADAFLEIAFAELSMNFITVGCLSENTSSRRAIEKYITRYNGDFYGRLPVMSTMYNQKNNIRLHDEYVITYDQYISGESGISCTIPGMQFSGLSSK